MQLWRPSHPESDRSSGVGEIVIQQIMYPQAPLPVWCLPPGEQVSWDQPTENSVGLERWGLELQRYWRHLISVAAARAGIPSLVWLGRAGPLKGASPAEDILLMESQSRHAGEAPTLCGTQSAWQMAGIFVVMQEPGNPAAGPEKGGGSPPPREPLYY